MSEDQFPVVIIGGGLAGLTAAVHLAEKGIIPLVLDADSLWTGGRLSGGDPITFAYEGREWSFNPDYGMHALWGGYVNMHTTLQKFTNTQLIPSSGEEWINRWGREVRRVEAGTAVRSGWLPAPFHYLQLLFRPRFWATITPLDFLSLPGFIFSILWAVGFDPIKEQSRLDGLMMSEFFRGWTPNLRASFTGVAVNLLAAPAESISLTSFIAAMRFYTILRRDLWRMDYLPHNSNKSIIQPLIHAIEHREGKIIKGATALRIERQPRGWRIVVEDSIRRGIRSLNASQIILAMDAAGTQRLLAGGKDTSSSTSEIQFPNTLRNAVVRAWFSTEPREGTVGGMFTGDFIVDNFFWLHKMYDDFKHWHDETGGSAIEVHIYGTEKLLDQPDTNLLIQAVNDIQMAFPELKGHFVHGVVQRNSRTHTEFRIPVQNSLHVKTHLPDIFACGDWVHYPSPAFWMERATVTGIAAANCVLEGQGLQPYPIVQLPRAELLVIILAVFVKLIRSIFSPVVLLLKALRNRK